jgi:hypothetical protein
VSQQQNPLERAVDLFVYAPIGVAMFARDTVPTFLKMFVSRGQTELQHRKKVLHDQANQYRAVGRFAVKYGGPEVRRAASDRLDGARRAAEETFTGLVVPRLSPSAGAPAPAPAREQAPDEDSMPAAARHGRVAQPAPAARAATNGDAPAEAVLAIPEYDQLSASQVVERLDGLSPDELDAVRAYELAHRGRSTILGKIVQLTG